MFPFPPKIGVANSAHSLVFDAGGVGDCKVCWVECDRRTVLGRQQEADGQQTQTEARACQEKKKGKRKHCGGFEFLHVFWFFFYMWIHIFSPDSPMMLPRVSFLRPTLSTSHTPSRVNRKLVSVVSPASQIAILSLRTPDIWRMVAL